MRVLVIDPIFSSLPYDKAFCAALSAEGNQVKIVGRTLRSGENWDVANVEHIALQIDDVIQQTSLTGKILKIYTLVRHVRYSIQIQHIEWVVRKYQPDVIHFQWCLTPIAEMYLIRRLRMYAAVVMTIHDTNPFNGSKVSSLVTRGLNRLMTRFDHLVVHTRSAADILAQRGLSPEKLSVIPHGLLKSPATPPKLGSNVLPNGEGRPIVCMLFGHIKHYKGADILIRAAALMSKAAQQNITFVIAGQLGVDFNALQKLCNEEGVTGLFRFELRFIPDAEVDALMQDADIFVFPYREIQASGVFTLALQYGRPIVASNLGIFAERIVEGVNGFLVPPGDYVALARALERLCEDAHLRQSMGNANIIASKKYPSWNEIARLTTAAYHSALAGKRAGVKSSV